MDKAKAAVKDFVSHSGQNDTTVHEKVAPAVTQETINKQRHEEVTTAIDREVHQDHYHTSVQPVKDREVLAEEHHHRMVPVEHREHHHGKDQAVKASLDQERQHFHDTTVQGQTRETHSTAPVIAGEHVHHHVHETIQPVVQKETIQPSVVHTTVPIHETHHKDPKHHAASALPAVSMADFKRQGGSLSGREEKFDGFAGEPKNIGGALSSDSHHHPTATGNTTAGPHDSNMLNKADPRVDSDRDGSRGYGTSGPTSTHGTSSGYGNTGTDNYGDSNRGLSGTTSGTGVAGEHKKPSLLDRLNPKKDTDHDGKAGMMD